jgi:nucleotide-binding universal stress UspA family protein
MKNILLPTDFSDNSRNAIQYAMKLFEGQSCEFFFLNIQKVSEFATDDIYTSSPKKTVYEAVVGDNKQRLQDFIAEFENRDANITFHTSIDYDVFTDAINQAVILNDIDLIIMGTNGATGAEKVLFGSNTLHVIRQVNCPVLAVPEGYIYKKLNDLVFSYHPGELIKAEKLKPIIELIKIHNASIKFLEIDEPSGKKNIDEDLTRSLKKIFSNINQEYFYQKGIPTPMAVNSFEQLIDVQMHATFIDRKSFLNRFIFGSETTKIHYQTLVPLLILHRK